MADNWPIMSRRPDGPVALAFCVAVIAVGSRAPTPVPATCGDGVVDTGEDCDHGSDNGAPGDCCSEGCRFEPADVVCRPQAGVCDLPETCNGAGECPPDQQAADGTGCSDANCNGSLACACRAGLCSGPPPSDSTGAGSGGCSFALGPSGAPGAPVVVAAIALAGLVGRRRRRAESTGSVTSARAGGAWPDCEPESRPARRAGGR